MVNHKKRFITIVAVVLVFAIVNTVLFFTKGNSGNPGISGMLVFNVSDSEVNMSMSQMAFILQWVVALIILAGANIQYMKSRKEEKIKEHYISVKEKHGKSNTDFDALYSLLKKNKTLKIATISKVFNVDKEKALEWAKILENNNLAQIEYPAFSDAEITLKHEEESPSK
jgi:hypothetical protein